MSFCLFRAVLNVCFCTGHFVMVLLNLTCLHFLQHSFFKHLFKLCFHILTKLNLPWKQIFGNIFLRLFKYRCTCIDILSIIICKLCLKILIIIPQHIVVLLFDMSLDAFHYFIFHFDVYVWVRTNTELATPMLYKVH